MAEAIGAEVDKPDLATQVYTAMLPAIAGQPIASVSQAMMTHLAVMIDQMTTDNGQARKASVDVGEQIWGMVLMMRKRRGSN